jgi:hypothetical protein
MSSQNTITAREKIIAARRRYTQLQIISLSFLLSLLLLPPLFSSRPTPAKATSSSLSSSNATQAKPTDGKTITRITCTVPDAKTKEKILQEATRVFGVTGYRAQITVNTSAKPLQVLDALPEIFAKWKEEGGTQQDLDNGRLTLTLEYQVEYQP